MRAGDVFMMSGYPPYTAIASAYFAKCEAIGGSLTPLERSAINTFIVNSGSDIYEFDRFYILGLQNQTSCTVSLLNPTSSTITLVNNPTFTPGIGIRGNGVNSYINTNFNAATQGVKYTATSSLYGYYQNIMNTTSDSDGIYVGANQILLYKGNGTSINPSINDVSFDVSNKNNQTGLISMRRVGTNKYSNVNGVDSSPLSRAVSAIPNGNIFVLARNQNNGAVGSFSNARLSVIFFGSASIDMVKLNTNIQALATTLGFNV